MPKEKLRGRAKDMTGQIFERLTVLSVVRFPGRPALHWRCRCACGTITVVAGPHLRFGGVKSCGCLRRDTNTTHGMTKHKLYRVWDDMLQRCNPKYAVQHPAHAGEGIEVCEEWKDSSKFLEWAIRGWKEGLTLDRRDNTKGYSPANCRWRTRLEQTLNRRNTNWMTYKGKRMCCAHVADAVGLSRATLDSRIRAGWPRHKWFISSTRGADNGTEQRVHAESSRDQRQGAQPDF